MRIVITHAYSRGNAGDGLLVDEAIAIAREAFGPGSEISLIALDPDSFRNEVDGVSNPFSTGEHRFRSLLGLLRNSLTNRMQPEARRRVQQADLVLAVGGGYLRGSTCLEWLKAYLVHRPQLPKRVSPPTAYLPQSIGPFPGKSAAGFGNLGNASVVAVRDDRSLAEMREAGVRCVRLPDMAVMAISRDVIEPKTNGKRVGLVFRKIRGSDESLRGLARITLGEMLVQAEVGGNDDRAFYREKFSQVGLRHLSEALNASDHPSVVVSVRLHGALLAILHGIPSIHLSYERKGWGAFHDLGLQDYVHNVRSFDLQRVNKQVQDLAFDSAPYWSKVRHATTQVRHDRSLLLSALRDLQR